MSEKCEDQEHMVVDPLCSMYLIPHNYIELTLGMNEKQPTLCLVHQEGQCRLGDECRQIHAQSNYVYLMRKMLRNNNCCYFHGDLFSKHGEHRRRPPFIYVMLQTTEIRLRIHTDYVARTIYEDFRSLIPLNKICRFHLQNQCHSGRICRYVHICRDKWKELSDQFPELSSLTDKRRNPIYFTLSYESELRMNKEEERKDPLVEIMFEKTIYKKNHEETDTTQVYKPLLKDLTDWLEGGLINTEEFLLAKKALIIVSDPTTQLIELEQMFSYKPEMQSDKTSIYESEMNFLYDLENLIRLNKELHLDNIEFITAKEALFNAKLNPVTIKDTSSKVEKSTTEFTPNEQANISRIKLLSNLESLMEKKLAGHISEDEFRTIKKSIISIMNQDRDNNSPASQNKSDPIST